MKTLPLALACSLVLGLAMASLADDKPKNSKDDKKVKVDAAKLVGTWEITYSDAALPKGSTIEFTKEGKSICNYTVNDKPFTVEMDYTVDENIIKFTKKKPKMEETWTVSKFAAKEFETGTSGGGTMKWSKKK
jgi:uncharacterized protein (TIGR03066 family)